MRPRAGTAVRPTDGRQWRSSESPAWRRRRSSAGDRPRRSLPHCIAGRPALPHLLSLPLPKAGAAAHPTAQPGTPPPNRHPPPQQAPSPVPCTTFPTRLPPPSPSPPTRPTTHLPRRHPHRPAPRHVRRRVGLWPRHVVGDDDDPKPPSEARRAERVRRRRAGRVGHHPDADARGGEGVEEGGDARQGGDPRRGTGHVRRLFRGGDGRGAGGGHVGEDVCLSGGGGGRREGNSGRGDGGGSELPSPSGCRAAQVTAGTPRATRCSTPRSPTSGGLLHQRRRSTAAARPATVHPPAPHQAQPPAGRSTRPHDAARVPTDAATPGRRQRTSSTWFCRPLMRAA